MLNIDSLQNGVVIDHIPAGQGLDIYRLLNLDAQSHSVALLQYVKSEKYGCKDLIKIEGTKLPERLDKDGKVDKKYHPLPPKILTNVIKCKNPRCITSIETGCEHIFKLYPSGKYRCLYCNEEISVR